MTDLRRLLQLKDRVNQALRLLRGLHVPTNEIRMLRDAIEVLSREEDDRCERCQEFDHDGCPSCGPLTHRRVYGVD